MIKSPMPVDSPAPSRTVPGGWACWALGSILLLTIAAYAMSFDGPFIFDDLTAIPNNPHVRQLWPLAEAMTTPERSTTAGRPLVAYTFAINFAVSGDEVWSYHLFNLLLHLANAALLWQVVRRSFASVRVPEVLRQRAGLLAWAVAVIWAVHPIHSETVVYVVQRTELMVSLFMLLSILALWRAAKSERGDVWQVVVVLFAVLGVLCKEVMAVMPLLLLLYDRAFVAGTFGQALRRRGWMYLGLVSVWGLAAVITMQGHRGGLGEGPEMVWRYLLTQGGVILWYLKLIVLPYPLAVTYDWPLVETVWQSLPEAAIVLILLLLTFYAIVRHPKLGFLGAVFFFILAPSSSFIPILTEVVGERRMYLPAVPVLVLAVVGLYYGLRWGMGRLPVGAPAGGAAAVGLGCVVMGLSIGAAMATHARTGDYDDDLRLWSQTVRVQPRSPMALNNLVSAYIHLQRMPEAKYWLGQLERVNPKHKHLPMHWGMITFYEGRYREAANYFEEATRREKDEADAYAYAGLCYGLIDQNQKAEEFLAKALVLEPNNRLAANSLGLLLDKRGDVEAAVATLRDVVARYDDFPAAHGNLAVALDKIGRTEEARQHFQRAYQLAPQSVEILRNYGTFEARHKNWGVAERVLREGVKISPGHKEMLFALAALLRQTERYAESGNIYRSLLRAHPDDPVLHNDYAILLVATDRLDEAKAHIETALSLDPHYEDAKRSRFLLGKIIEQVEAGASVEQMRREALEGHPERSGDLIYGSPSGE